MCVDKKPLQQAITDDFLVREFKRNAKNIAFINYEPKLARFQRRKHLLEKIDALSEEPDLYRQQQAVFAIWTYLVESAIVYLKSQDQREEPYHDDAAYGVRKLTEFFKAFQEFEPLLYGAEGELYREHITHMFSVFLLGDYLIRKGIGFDKVIVGDPELSIGEKILDSEKEAMWCIISLTHDLGYALEGIPLISPKARKMLEAFGLAGTIQELSYWFPQRPLHDLLLNFISSDLLKHPREEGRFLSHKQSKYFLKFAEAFERYEHGVISCLVLMKNLVYFLETDYLLDDHKPLGLEDARQFQIRRDILRSIAGHSCNNIYYVIIPRFDFLLKIVDEMHEWGRPRFADLFAEPPKTEVIVKEFNNSEVYYCVEFYPPDASLTAEEEKSMKEFAWQYFKDKCNGLFMTLRSAVVGPPTRSIKATFEVADLIGDPSKYHTYKIVHTSPEDVGLFVDSRPERWQYFEKKGGDNGS